MTKTRNILVYKEDGRYPGWPANHGAWAWGNEFVVGFALGDYLFKTEGPAVDSTKPYEMCQSPSIDGGETWSIERPEEIRSHVDIESTTIPIRDPLSFEHPGFALMFKFGSRHTGPSRSTFPMIAAGPGAAHTSLGSKWFDHIVARTDYIIRGPRECIMFRSMAKSNRLEGRAFCTRTSDGGLTWSSLATIGPEPEGYLIMPSTISLGGDNLLTTLRHKDPDLEGSIDAYKSDDLGATWQFRGEAASHIGSGNPPSLFALSDGRLCLTYGYRARPYGIRARISPDQGASWLKEIILRDDGLAEDLGYVRSFQRSDGSIVTVYYFNGPEHRDRTLEATIWTC